MQKRKDNKGRVLKDGESYREKENRYSYRWTDKQGKRHSIYASSLEELRKREAETANDIYEGIRTESKNVTVNDMYQAWKNDKKGLRSSTRGNYSYMYDQYVKDGFGKIKLKEVRKSDVRRFYNELHDTRNLSFNTIEIIHNVIHQLFALAVDDEYIRNNPTDRALTDCKLAHNYQRPKRHALTIPEQTAFIEYIKNNPKFSHWLPLFTFFLGTGCRVSEVIALRWEDIDFDDGIISINHGITYYQREENKCYFSISEDTKTEAGKRIIPMLSEVRQALLNEREYQKEAEITCQVTINGYTDFVFLNRFGNVHNPQTINRAIKRIVKLHNLEEIEIAEKKKREPIIIPNFSCHNLRHTFATRYCENESNIKVIQEILGHKDIATTMDVYAEATRDAKKKSFTDLDGKIKIT